MSLPLPAPLLAASVLLGAQAALAQPEVPPVSEQLREPKSADVTIVGHVLEPAQLEPTPERLARLQLPPGFEITVFAEGLVNPRMLAVAGDGTVYVTRRTVGDALMLKDTDGDGRADVEERVASRPGMHGLAVDGDTVYLTTVEDIYRATRAEDGTLGALELILDDLPAGGQHPNRMVVVGPDGNLYVSVGSTCNACGETDARNATMMRITPDGSYSTVFASGLRNTIGYGFEPATGALYGMDHGIDWLGDNEQAEELNHLVEGAKYGWPYVYADGKPNPQDYPPAGISMEEWTTESTDPVGLYTPHAAPMQMAFYTGEVFPEDYRGDAFIAMRGSWNRKPPSGYEVLRITFEDGRPTGFEPFVTGFLMQDEESPNGWGHLGRLAGLAQTPDGALLLSDDTNGVIYRIAYTGSEAGTAEDAALELTNPAGAEIGVTGGEAAAAATDPAAEPVNALATAILDAPAALDVTSPAFADETEIPEIYAAEAQNLSPPLAWDEGPEGTRSYALLVEDPDVEGAPFVHWIAYAIPADVTELREGLPGTPQLPLPEGMKQGENGRGTTGWTGMKPPEGAPAHDYHFQIFALDTMPEIPHGASRAEVLDALRGHVLAGGEITGRYQRPE